MKIKIPTQAELQPLYDEATEGQTEEQWSDVSGSMRGKVYGFLADGIRDCMEEVFEKKAQADPLREELREKRIKLLSEICDLRVADGCKRPRPRDSRMHIFTTNVSILCYESYKYIPIGRNNN